MSAQTEVVGRERADRRVLVFVDSTQIPDPSSLAFAPGNSFGSGFYTGSGAGGAGDCVSRVSDLGGRRVPDHEIDLPDVEQQRHLLSSKGLAATLPTDPAARHPCCVRTGNASCRSGHSNGVLIATLRYQLGCGASG